MYVAVAEFKKYKQEMEQHEDNKSTFNGSRNDNVAICRCNDR